MEKPQVLGVGTGHGYINSDILSRSLRPGSGSTGDSVSYRRTTARFLDADWCIHVPECEAGRVMR